MIQGCNSDIVFGLSWIKIGNIFWKSHNKCLTGDAFRNGFWGRKQEQSA